MSLTAKEDRRGNFHIVNHTASSDQFLVHQDDLPKVGTGEKLAVYELKPQGFLPPGKGLPKGKYLHKTRVYLGTFLEMPPQT